MNRKSKDTRLFTFLCINLFAPIAAALLAYFLNWSGGFIVHWLYILLGLVNFFCSFSLRKKNCIKQFDILVANLWVFLVFGGIMFFLPETRGYGLWIYLGSMVTIGWLAGIWAAIPTVKASFIRASFAIIFLLSGHWLIPATYGFLPKKKSPPSIIKLGGHLDFRYSKPIMHIDSARQKAPIKVAECWATWCRPCIGLLPSFEELHQQYKSNPEVYLMTIDMGDGYRETEEKAKKYVEKKGYSFPLYYNEQANLYDSVGVNAIPLTIITYQDTVQSVMVGSPSNEFYKKKISHIIDSLLVIHQEVSQ